MTIEDRIVALERSAQLWRRSAAGLTLMLLVGIGAAAAEKGEPQDLVVKSLRVMGNASTPGVIIGTTAAGSGSVDINGPDARLVLRSDDGKSINALLVEDGASLAVVSAAASSSSRCKIGVTAEASGTAVTGEGLNDKDVKFLLGGNDGGGKFAVWEKNGPGARLP